MAGLSRREQVDSQGASGKLRTLEVGRFIAASLVMISHLGPTVAKYAATPLSSPFLRFDFGPVAVHYFFVLSGFVMALSHARDFGQITAIPRFFWRRVSRIFPLFWLAMSVPMLLNMHNLNLGLSLRLLSLAPVNVSELLPPAWSLRFEVAFYLIFGLCLLPRIGKPLLAAWMIVAAWVASSYGAGTAHLLPAPPATLLALRDGWTSDLFSHPVIYFITGTLAGFAFPALKPSTIITATALGFSALAFIISLDLTAWGSSDGTPATHIFVAITMAFLILSLAQAETSGLFHIGKAGAALGAISYPLYILHWSLFILYDHIFGAFRFQPFGVAVLYVAAFAGIYAIASLAAFGFDLPVQKFLRRFLKSPARHRPGPSPQSAP